MSEMRGAKWGRSCTPCKQLCTLATACTATLACPHLAFEVLLAVPMVLVELKKEEEEGKGEA